MGNARCGSGGCHVTIWVPWSFSRANWISSRLGDGPGPPADVAADDEGAGVGPLPLVPVEDRPPAGDLNVRDGAARGKDGVVEGAGARVEADGGVVLGRDHP